MDSEQKKDSRRRAPRFAVQGTTLLWPEDGRENRTIRTRTKDISTTGLWIYGDFNQQVGSGLRFEIELPAPIGGKSGCLLRGHARLVRYEELAGNRVGFGAEIVRYEMAPSRKLEQNLKASKRQAE